MPKKKSAVAKVVEALLPAAAPVIVVGPPKASYVGDARTITDAVIIRVRDEKGQIVPEKYEIVELTIEGKVTAAKVLDTGSIAVARWGVQRWRNQRRLRPPEPI
jgi:hypothetical protein